MNQYGTLITNIGLAKMANAQITQTKVKVTHIAIGDGNGGEYVPEPTQTSLVNEVWRGNVGDVTIDSENDKRIIADVLVPANVGGFTIREVGLFDEEGDLIAVSPFPPKYKPALEEGIADDMLIHFTIETANASSISLEIDPNIIVATRKYVDEKVNKVANDLGTVEQTVNAHLAEKATQSLLGHIKLQESWINATLQNGWTGNLEYAKNDLGLVSLKYDLFVGTTTVLTVISTLPVGYRPQRTCVLHGIEVASGNYSGQGLYIDIDGIIRVPNGQTYAEGDTLQGTVTYYAG